MLRHSQGRAWSVSNERVFNAARMFYSLEGVDIGPAAAVALDALCQAVATGAVKSHDYVLLHVTGGGRELQYSEGRIFRAQPSLHVKPVDLESVLSIVGKPTPMSTNTMARVLSRCEDLVMRGTVA